MSSASAAVASLFLDSVWTPFIDPVKKFIQNQCPDVDHAPQFFRFREQMNTWTPEQWNATLLFLCKEDPKWIMRVERWLQNQCFQQHLEMKLSHEWSIPIIHPIQFVQDFLTRLIERLAVAIENCIDRKTPNLIQDTTYNFRQIFMETFQEILAKQWNAWLNILSEHKPTQLLTLITNEIQAQNKSSISAYVAFRKKGSYQWIQQRANEDISHNLLQQQLAQLKMMIRLMQHQQKVNRKGRLHDKKKWTQWIKQFRKTLHSISEQQLESLSRLEGVFRSKSSLSNEIETSKHHLVSKKNQSKKKKKKPGKKKRQVASPPSSLPTESEEEEEEVISEDEESQSQTESDQEGEEDEENEASSTESESKEEEEEESGEEEQNENSASESESKEEEESGEEESGEDEQDENDDSEEEEEEEEEEEASAEESATSFSPESTPAISESRPIATHKKHKTHKAHKTHQKKPSHVHHHHHHQHHQASQYKRHPSYIQTSSHRGSHSSHADHSSHPSRTHLPVHLPVHRQPLLSQHAHSNQNIQNSSAFEQNYQSIMNAGGHH